MQRTEAARGWLLGALMVALVGLIALALSTEQRSTDEPRPAIFDQATGTCVGDEPVSRQECEGVVALLEATLKNAATAQESHLVSTGANRYTDQVTDLEREGLVVDPLVDLTIIEATESSYCLVARTEELGGAMLRYDSNDGTVSVDGCR